MKQLQINVTKDNVTLVHPVPQIMTGEYKVTQVSFDFSEEWSDKTKKARFGDVEVDVINDACYFPMLLKTGTIPIKVYGYNEEVVDGETVKVLVYSPQPALIHIEQGSYDGTAGGSSPTPPPEEDADYLTKSRLWSGYSMFFETLTEVPQEIQDEYNRVDVLSLTTAQIEEAIEKINKMLLDAQAVKYITVDTQQSDINKDLVNSIITVRTNGSLAGSGSVKISATGVTSYIEVYKNTFIGLGTPMQTERLQIYANRIVYGKGSGGTISEEKSIYFPTADVSSQNIDRFALLSDLANGLVTLDTDQEITGSKSFVYSDSNHYSRLDVNYSPELLFEYTTQTGFDETNIQVWIDSEHPENSYVGYSDKNGYCEYKIPKFNDDQAHTFACLPITNADIMDGTITSSKIGSDAVERHHIALKAISGDLIDDFTINSNNINTSAVTSAKIKNGAVDEYKLSQTVVERLDKNYVHEQTTASNIWVIIHNLNKYPSAVVFDSTGDEVVGDITYDSLNQITIQFKGAFKGKATLN